MNQIPPPALLQSMLRIRRIEEALADRYKEQEMRCPMHLCIGQEAIAVGVAAALRADDCMYSNHRAHGHYLAKGGDLTAMIAELYGRQTGCCGGRGGSMHLIDTGVAFMGSTPIVGGTVPLAVGSAWAASLQKRDTVTVIFFGDGCFEEGVVHESMNFATLHRLPVLFVCENNDFSVYTRRNERQAERPIYRIAEAHGMSAAQGDGNDVEQVQAMTSRAVADLRVGRGPWFLEFHAYRWREHCGPDFDDHLNYRSAAEIASGKLDCPIERFKSRLLVNRALLPEDILQMEQSVRSEIDTAFSAALLARKPTNDEASTYVYA
ncbi:thiamine pyrophosphate-dependent dehydrogenase E1 component subunit alpha [Herbaspirillum huttiense]|uniref:thiamine pyrophosphate-dependent dehydrogenase E1 component subunit alpha n=1 Tax=Herbaspirillum huttiense TaxID=863372 RepID=UPI0021769AC0|nr:thiamine pyrophosphate-dependent dehydrogenase E1 component subunit alpha [Herbaspirillum huttiense]UWE16081.1 thiamine pyrophosphate-dependent dehydrogenase E1 component subunit alpha [Herbaspirillum huttiense]